MYSKEEILRKALETARIWFKSFGWNQYGIAVKDDFSDPEEVLKEIEKALEETK